MYYWKVKFEIEHSPELIVYADNAKQCDLLVRAWLKKQNRSDLKYKKGDSYNIKKGTDPEILNKELEHLKDYIDA